MQFACEGTKKNAITKLFGSFLCCLEINYYLCRQIYYKQNVELTWGQFPQAKYKYMEATVLNPTQMHLLKLFAFNNSEEYAREIQMVLTRHFQAQLDAEADRLWDEGILNQEKLDAIRQEDLHAK